MPLPKITDFKSNHNYDAEEDNKSFRARVTENLNFTRIAKEIESNQNKTFTASNQNNNDYNDDDDEQQQHVQQRPILQNRHKSRKIISLNYDFNRNNDEDVLEPTKKIIFNKSSNKYKNKFASNNHEQVVNKILPSNKNNNINNNSTELFQLNDKGKLLKIVKIPSFKNSQQQSPLRSSRSAVFDNRKGFDDLDIEDDRDDEVIYNSANATPAINTSRSSTSSKNSAFLNVDNINKYKQKKDQFNNNT
jgi:hypothetical protein